MHRIRKSVIALMALLMIAGVPLTADTMSVTWEWLLDDPEVTVYRYQLDGEDPDGWTEIGGDESTLSLSIQLMQLYPIPLSISAEPGSAPLIAVFMAMPSPADERGMNTWAESNDEPRAVA